MTSFCNICVERDLIITENRATEFFIQRDSVTFHMPKYLNRKVGGCQT